MDKEPNRNYDNPRMDPSRDSCRHYDGKLATKKDVWSAHLGCRSALGKLLHGTEDFCPFLFFYKPDEDKDSEEDGLPYCLKTNPERNEIRALLHEKIVQERCLTKKCRECERYEIAIDYTQYV